MSIKRKINAGIFTMLVLMIAMALFTYNRISVLQTSFEKEVQEGLHIVELANSLRYSLSVGGIQLRDYVTIQSETSRLTLEGSNNNAKEYLIELKQLTEGDSQASELLKKVEQGLQNFEVASTELVEAVEKKDNDTEINLKLEAAKDISASFSNTLTSITKYETAKVKVANEEINKTAYTAKIIAFVLGVIGVINTITFLFLIRKSIMKPLEKVIESTKIVSQGDYSSADIIHNTKDEFGQLATAFNQMKNNTRHLVQDIADNASQLSASIEELSASTVEVAHASNDIAEQIEMTAKGASVSASSASDSSVAMEETATGVLRIASSSQQLFDDAKDANELAVSGGEVLRVAKNQMQIISESTSKTHELISKLGEQTKEIQNMSKIITDITDQTNLLSLNAAIEAARAGEHGKGFAVVAQEVGKLAEQSKKSASEIVKLTTSIQLDTEEVTTSVQNGLKNVQEGVYVIENAELAFGNIEGSVGRMTAQIEEITATSEQLSAGTEQVNASVSEIASHAGAAVVVTSSITAAAEEQSATLQEINSVVTELSHQAVHLQELTQSFKV